MALSPEPSAEAAGLGEAERRQLFLADLFRADAPDEADRLALATALFLTAQERFQNAVFHSAELEQPSLKKIGMALSSLLLRSRELNARYRGLAEAVSTLAPPAAEVARLDSLITRAAAHVGGHWPAPSWDIPTGPWLERQLRRVFQGCRSATMAARWLDSAANRATWPAVLTAMRDAFARDAFSALAGTGEGDDLALLKGLPQTQEHVTRLLYQEEFRA